MDELVTRRLWATDLPAKWGWQPIPSRQTLGAVRMGYAVDRQGDPVSEITWTVATDWWQYTWAWHVLEVRRKGSDRDHDPRLPRKPFGWLT
jgi:hypothetical protein